MTDRLLGFAGVCVLLTFVPEVDTAMVTRSTLGRGTRAGVQTALGAASGCSCTPPPWRSACRRCCS